MKGHEPAEDILGKGLVLALVLCFAVFLYAASSQALPGFGEFPLRQWEGFRVESIGAVFNEQAAEDCGTRNIVAAVMWDYRGFDTLGEVTLLFTAVCAVAALFRREMVAGRGSESKR